MRRLATLWQRTTSNRRSRLILKHYRVLCFAGETSPSGAYPHGPAGVAGTHNPKVAGSNPAPATILKGSQLRAFSLLGSRFPSGVKRGKSNDLPTDMLCGPGVFSRFWDLTCGPDLCGQDRAVRRFGRSAGDDGRQGAPPVQRGIVGAELAGSEIWRGTWSFFSPSGCFGDPLGHCVAVCSVVEKEMSRTTWPRCDCEGVVRTWRPECHP